jgi:hypothetical protein
MRCARYAARERRRAAAASALAAMEHDSDNSDFQEAIVARLATWFGARTAPPSARTERLSSAADARISQPKIGKRTSCCNAVSRLNRRPGSV